jgi:hypothetical protein
MGPTDTNQENNRPFTLQKPCTTRSTLETTPSLSPTILSDSHLPSLPGLNPPHMLPALLVVGELSSTVMEIAAMSCTLQRSGPSTD